MDSRTLVQRWLALVIASLSLTGFGQAQVLYGSLVGTVTDPSGAAIPAAMVTLTNEETGVGREQAGDTEGRFAFTNVLPGRYLLLVTATGFRPQTATGIVVTPNTVVRQAVAMALGELTDSVTVAAGATVLQTDKSDTHTEISRRELAALPLGGLRNYQALINLVPGATPGVENSPIDLPVRSFSTQINGTAATQNSTRLDGAVNVNVWVPNNVAYIPPADTIDVVNVSTGSFDAEQGLAGGAAITVVTRSGGNRLQGSAYDYFSNDDLRARNYFMPATATKPKFSRHQFGGTLGGPIVTNRLFYFGGYEGIRERVPGQGFFTVPTEAMRRGDFSEVATRIYDPATGAADGSARQAFADNRIPAGRLDPIPQRILALVPLPNQPGLTNNYYTQATGRFDRDNYDLKVNLAATTAQQVWGKYSRMDATGGGVFALGEAGGPGVGGDSGTGDTTQQVITLGQTWTLTPQMVFDQTFGYTRFDQEVYGADFGTNYGSDLLGIPGTNGPDPRQSGMPAFQFNTFTNYGNTNSWMPLFRNDRTWTYTNNLTALRGSHELRAGVDVVRLELNHWQPEGFGGPRGAFSFGGGVTALRGGAAPNQYNSFAQFLLGLSSSTTKSLQYIPFSGREWQFGVYLRDRWQVSRSVTVNLGLRFEHFPLMTRDGAGIERLDFETLQVHLGGRGGVPTDAGIRLKQRHWAPRVGIAWRATEAMVLRAGYGLTNDNLPFSRPLRGFYPYNIGTTFVGADGFRPFGTLAAGIPVVNGPDLGTGVVDLPNVVAMRAPGDTLTRGYVQSWNATLEHQLPLGFVGSVGYVGTKTSNQLAELDVNAAGPGAGNNGRPYFASSGRSIALNRFDGFLDANYHSLQATLNRRFQDGLLVKGAYTYSKTLNMSDQNGWASVMWNSLDQLDRNYAPAGYDVPHNLQMAAVYELPFGPGRRWLNSGVLGHLLGNWDTNVLFYAYSGTPFTVTAAGTSLNAPGNAQTADQVADVKKLGGIGSGKPYYDPTSFAAITAVRYGNSGRNILRRPGVVGADLGVFRGFDFIGRSRLEVRAEVFNVTDRPRWGQPGSSVTSGNFLVITSAGGERQARIAARLSF